MALALGVVTGVQEAAHRGQAGWPIDPSRWARLRAGVDALFVQLSTAGEGIVSICSALKAGFCFQGQARRKQIYKV